MVFTLTIPAEYGFVLATATLSTLVAHWHTIRVGRYRKAAKVLYPNSYAPDSEAKSDQAKYLFNCAQRAHANFLEHQPQFLIGLLLSGLSYPTVSAGLGLVWCIGRVMYGIGYTDINKPVGKGRMIGSFFWIAELALQLSAAFTGWKMIAGW